MSKLYKLGKGTFREVEGEEVEVNTQITKEIADKWPEYFGHGIPKSGSDTFCLYCFANLNKNHTSIGDNRIDCLVPELLRLKDENERLRKAKYATPKEVEG